MLRVSSRIKPSWESPRRQSYATVRGSSFNHNRVSVDDAQWSENDFILSILRSKPSFRDSKSYLASFGTQKPSKPSPSPSLTTPTTQPSTSTQLNPAPAAAAILDPIHRHTALVKLQGPFTERQLDSIVKGLVYLEKLGLVSVVVVERDDRVKGDDQERKFAVEDALHVASALEQHGARARPLLETFVRLGPKEGSDDPDAPEAHTTPSDLISLRCALRAGEIPVLPPLALDSFCRSVRVDADDVIVALAQGMTETAATEVEESSSKRPSMRSISNDVNLTPLRLMIINREGGIPSYARSGLPHLLINMEQEFSHIHDTFHKPWLSTHPTALSNLALARRCLNYMPPSSSAIVVSHRSPKSLIGNLITNKPELSSSLPHALLQNHSSSKVNPDTPTIVRRGLPIRVIRQVSDIDRPKLKALLEQSFGRKLDEPAFYARLQKYLDFVIVAGDYAGAAIVTNEPTPSGDDTIAYLDKFAVLPSHQGDGTVDFLWVALHDESYGLGLSYSVNPNGGKEGQGEGRDLVWRSRSNNPVNKWYFERSTGHLRLGDWTLFWCDAEKRLKGKMESRGRAGMSYVEGWETDRLSAWTKSIMSIPSVWY